MAQIHIKIMYSRERRKKILFVMELDLDSLNKNYYFLVEFGTLSQICDCTQRTLRNECEFII